MSITSTVGAKYAANANKITCFYSIKGRFYYRNAKSAKLKKFQVVNLVLV